MSQKAIKKRTIDNYKNSMRIPVQPLSGKTNGPSAKQTTSLPEKTFPLNKFIALPEGLRPKSSSTSSADDVKSPKRSTPIKAVAIPSRTSVNDSRSGVYVVDGPGGRRTEKSDRSNEASITDHSVNSCLYNHTSLSSDKVVINGSVNTGVVGPYATSTPISPRRSSQSAHRSQDRGSNLTSQGSFTSTDSFDSTASGGSRKRRYKKRSQSAPPDNSRRKVQDTDLIIQQWAENDRQQGINGWVGQEIECDGISIQSENWTSAKLGLVPNGPLHTVYRSNSLSSPTASSVDNIKPTAHLNGSSHSELEFTDVCKVNPTFHNNTTADTSNASVHGQDFATNDTKYIDELTGGDFLHETNPSWANISDVEYTRTSEQGPQHLKSGHKFIRSWSDFNLHKPDMDRRSNASMYSSDLSSKSYTVNGIPQSGIVIRKSGGDNIFVNDMHNRSIPADYPGHEFYTVGRKQGTLMQSKMKFSSMPSLHDGKGDKKLMKLLKKQEKEERKRREKEERKRAKEEKKRLKMEKKLQTKTLPRNFAYTNGHVLSPAMENMYRRPKLTMTAVPIDIEGDNQSVTSSSSRPAPTHAPPPLPNPSQRTMALYSSAPDLLRIEQIYGATLRGVPNAREQYSRPGIPGDYGPRSVVLQRASEGYGFVLRGAKSQLKPSGELDFRPSAEFPALQYLDSVDPGSVSDRAGLRPGDFILEINGENVVRASHDRVVHLIRSTGDTLAMKVVTVRHGARGGQDWFVQQDKSLTMPSRQKKKAAPTPPMRDPRTSLSISKSEGQSISEEMAAMEKLDLAISRQDSEEKKTASIRSRTAAKRVSCVELDNIGVDKKLERAKSTPDLIDGNSKARKDIVYATPTVPDKKSNVYAVPNVNSASSGSVVPPSPNGTRPKGAPPPPPGENASKKQAPKPPTPDSYDSSGSSEVVKINTNNQSPHSSSKIIVKSTRKSESPYESSFRPGDSAKLTEEPKSAVKNGGHQRTGSTGSAPKDVSFADDKVIDHAASFLKKHPNAKLLITAKGQESLRNKTSMMFEPEPDYDSDSGEDKSRSPVRSKSAKQRQSVTVISVGDQKEKPASAPLNKRYTIHSSIPSEEKSSGFVIPPRPEGPAPSPPSQQLTIVQQKKTAAPSPPQHNTPVTTIKVKADITPEKTPPLPVSEPPELPKTPPPDFDDAPSPRYNPPSPKAIPAAPAPPPAPALPPVSGGPPAPPPPPPPPVPSTDDLSKVKSNVKADYIAHVPVPQDAIALAVAKRQERIEKDGVKIGPLKPKAETAAPMDSNQAAIIAAVAKRRQQLEQQQDTSVVDAIENRLQKTKKLQAAKFSIAGSKPGGVKKDNDTKPEIKTNGVKVASKPSVIVQSNIKNPVSQPVKADIKAEKEETTSKPTELSFKVKPVSTGISKNQSGITEIKPNFAPKQVKTFNNDTKQTNGLSNTKVKSQESLRLKPQPLEKSYATARNNDNKTVSEQTNNENNKNGQNGQSDFLALAEKRRQEYLSRKQKSTESKSSTASTPERKSEKVSPPVSAKPKTGPMKALPNMNGDAYSNVPPPPPGFRDGGNNNVVQLEIIPPPANFSSDSGVESSNQHSPAFSPDTASVVSSLSTLSSLSGEGRGNGFDDVIAPPPPGFDDPDATVIPPPPEFGNEKKGGKTYNDKLVDQWLCNDVLDWLDSLAMGQYKSSFQKHCVDGKKLLGLSRNNYIDLGVTQVGHRMTIERAIKKSEVKQKNLANNVIASEHL